MKATFADSYYFLAMLSREDAGHEAAVKVSRALGGTVLTTTWVLTEVGDAMADPAHRAGFVAFVEALRADPMVEVVPASQELFESGLELYAQRQDKDWTLKIICLGFYQESLIFLSIFLIIL